MWLGRQQEAFLKNHTLGRWQHRTEGSLAPGREGRLGVKDSPGQACRVELLCGRYGGLPGAAAKPGAWRQQRGATEGSILLGLQCFWLVRDGEWGAATSLPPPYHCLRGPHTSGALISKGLSFVPTLPSGPITTCLVNQSAAPQRLSVLATLSWVPPSLGGRERAGIGGWLGGVPGVVEGEWRPEIFLGAPDRGAGDPVWASPPTLQVGCPLSPRKNTGSGYCEGP